MSSEALNHPHDRFVKEILSRKENARDFFFNYLPDQIRSLVDLDSLEICKDSFIEKGLKEYFSDLLYRVNLSSDQEEEQQPAYLYLLFEHKSSPEPRIAFHLLRYQVRIWELYLKQNPNTRKLPVIIPLVLYHGEEEWRVGIRFSDLIWPFKEELKTYVPDFSYLLYDLSAYSKEQIRGIAILRIFLLLLKYIHHPDLATYLRQIFPLLKELSQPDRGVVDYLESVIRYIFNATDKMSVDEVWELVEKNIPKQREGVIMTIAEQLIQQGLQQGLQQGELRTVREDIVGVLEARFGPIPPESPLREKLAGIADRTVLGILLRKAATAASLSELEELSATIE